MAETDYVSEEGKALAVEIRSRFCFLPPEAGIIFVSVRAVPAPEGKVTRFDIRLGISDSFEEGTGLALIKKVVQKELEGGYGVGAAVYLGLPGAAGKQGLSETVPA